MSALTSMRNTRLARPRLSMRGLVKAAAAIDARHRARLQLRELDDRMLRDIGVSPGDVAAELHRPLL